MGVKENFAAQEKFGAAVNSGKLEGLREAVAANALDHDPAPGAGAGAGRIHPDVYRDAGFFSGSECCGG